MQATDHSVDAEATPSAGLFKRLAAIFYDSLLLLGVLMGVNALIVTINRGEAIDSGWINVVNVLVIYGFFAWFWTHGGQTLGMRAWRLKAINDDGSALSWGKSAARMLLAVVSWSTLGLGYVWMYFNPQRRTWHEKLSRTQTVQLPKNPTGGEI